MPLTGAPLRGVESFVLVLGMRVNLVCPRGELRDSPNNDHLVCLIVAPPAFDPERGQREAPGEVSELDYEGTVFESSGLSLSSPLRGSFENAEEFHVCSDKGMEESGDSLCGHAAGVRSFKMSLKDSPRIPRTRPVS